MFSYYWYQPQGYNPFAPYRGTSNAFPYAINAGGQPYRRNCYNPTVPGAVPSGPTFCPSDEEILNYVINLENTRKLDDLSNVYIERPPEPNDVLAYDFERGAWVLTNYISGGEF